jgi:predicted DNA-binding mobile mystery protein A
MRKNYQLIRLKTLDYQLMKVEPLRVVKAPPQGWLRIVREAVGLSLRAVGSRINMAPQTIHAFERREAEGTLTLRNLRKVAGAMNCEVVYFLVPKSSKTKTFTKLAAAQSGFLANLMATEHSMKLEDQGVGGIDDRIEAAAKSGEFKK